MLIYSSHHHDQPQNASEEHEGHSKHKKTHNPESKQKSSVYKPPVIAKTQSIAATIAPIIPEIHHPPNLDSIVHSWDLRPWSPPNKVSDMEELMKSAEEIRRKIQVLEGAEATIVVKNACKLLSEKLFRLNDELSNQNDTSMSTSIHKPNFQKVTKSNTSEIPPSTDTTMKIDKELGFFGIDETSPIIDPTNRDVGFEIRPDFSENNGTNDHEKIELSSNYNSYHTNDE